MSPSGRGVVSGTIALATCQVGCIAALVFLSFDPGTPVRHLAALAMVAHIPYIALMVLVTRVGVPIKIWPVLAISLCMRLMLVAAPPVFSDDVYRYAWDGKVTDAGYNPYDHAPADPELVFLRDDGWKHINNRDLRTPYPPAAQAVFLCLGRLAPSLITFKLASAFADTGVTFLVMLLAGGAWWRRRGRQKVPDAGTAAAAGLVYGFNPLACIETGMSGHLEPFALLPLLLAVYLFGLASPRIRTLASSFFLAVACATKLVPVMLLPAMGRRNRWLWIAVPVLLVAFFAPILNAGTHIWESTDAMFRRWEGNAGMFAVMKAAVGQIVGGIASISRPEEMVHLSFMDVPARVLQGTFFSLHKDGVFDPSRPGAFSLEDISLFVAKAISAAILLAVIAKTYMSHFDVERAALWIMATFVIVSPVVHPWYLLWVLPFAALRGTWPWPVFSGTLFLAYLPIDGWLLRGVWEAPGWVPWIEYGTLLVSFAVWRYFRRVNRKIDEKNDSVDPNPCSQ